MQVTQVTPFLVDSGGSKNWLFVKVETDEGLIGWGECYTQADRDGAMLAHLERDGPLPGRAQSVRDQALHSVMYLDYALRRPAMDFWSALSGLEQALWDIVGKALRPAGLQPARRSVPRAHPRVRQRLVGAARALPDEYAQCAARRRRARLHRAQVRSVHRSVAHAYRSRRGGPGRRARARRARGGRSGRRDPGRGASTAGAQRGDPHGAAAASRSSRSGTRSRSTPRTWPAWPRCGGASRCRS